MGLQVYELMSQEGGVGNIKKNTILLFIGQYFMAKISLDISPSCLSIVQF